MRRTTRYPRSRFEAEGALPADRREDDPRVDSWIDRDAQLLWDLRRAGGEAPLGAALAVLLDL
jgi:hypothetical protein